MSIFHEVCFDFHHSHLYVIVEANKRFFRRPVVSEHGYRVVLYREEFGLTLWPTPIFSTDGTRYWTDICGYAFSEFDLSILLKEGRISPRKYIVYLPRSTS